MIFSAPISFAEALQSRAVRSVLPTTLGSAELLQIPADILERALFSARVMNAEHLQLLSDIIARTLRGELDLATGRMEMKQFLRSIGYVPDAGDEGTLKDFSSTERINLQIEIPVAMAHGYGNWMQGQQPAVLMLWPAQELYRQFNRKTHRAWRGDAGDGGDIIKGEPAQGRWQEAGGKLYGGKMIALKNNRIWTNISRFGNPYPPFDFNSGMGVRDIGRIEAIEMGLLKKGEQIKPETRNFNQDLKFTAAVREAALREALESYGYTFTGDVLSL